MLFGHQNDDNKPAFQDAAVTGQPSVNPLAIDPVTGASLPTVPDDLQLDTASLSEPVLNQPQAQLDYIAPISDVPPAPIDTTVAPVMPIAPLNEDLLAIKQQALQQLGPMVDHLEQSPEEKFRTTMMMIQSSDNASLIKTAYEAAQAIVDEKTRAQALLDVINEINYFTKQGPSTPQA